MFTLGKFNIIGTLAVEAARPARGGVYTITIPASCTIEFSISRQSISASQTGDFIIKGLSPELRDAIFKDQFNTTEHRAIQFWAGYGTFAPLIFNGEIFYAYSEKPEGSPEVQTHIHAFDGGFQQTNGYTSGYGVPNQAIPPGTSAAEVISHLGASLPFIAGPPIIGSFPQTNMRHEVIFGNTWGLIQDRCGRLATIDGQIPKVLNLNEVIDGNKVKVLSPNTTFDTPIPLISADTGLLGSPRRSGFLVEWDTLFEPRLSLFQLVQVQSRVNPKFNGAFKVMGFTHHGIVSPTTAGDNRTTFTVLFGTNAIAIAAQFSP